MTGWVAAERRLGRQLWLTPAGQVAMVVDSFSIVSSLMGTGLLSLLADSSAGCLVRPFIRVSTHAKLMAGLDRPHSVRRESINR